MGRVRMTTEDNPLVMHRLGELEKKVGKIEDNTNQMAIDFAVAKTELMNATGKTSTLIASVVSVLVAAVGTLITWVVGKLGAQ